MRIIKLAKQSRRFRILIRTFGRSGFLLALVLLVMIAWRLVAPTQKGWCLFPMRDGNLICQNYGLWLMGRCYGDRKAYEAINSAARHLRSVYPDAHLAYMDVSGRRPSRRLWPHRSHGQGVDIDLLYIGRKRSGAIYPASSSVIGIGYLQNYDRSGRCGTIRFDAEANWVLVEGLYLNPSLKVEAIFVEPYIRKWLLEEGKRREADPKVIAWASDRLRYAGDEAARHDDHLHVRFRKP